MSNQKLTSVKIDSSMWDNFMVECIKRKFSFQKLAERSIHLYLTNEEFRKQVSSHTNLEFNTEE